MTNRMANRNAASSSFAFCLLVSQFLSTLTLAPLPVSAAWQGTGPFGGAAEIVRTVPKVSGLVIAGTHNGLIYVSRNGGAYWSSISFPGQFTGVLHSLEVDP